MAGVAQLVRWQYEQILNETKTDPVIDSWFLMGSPWPLLTIVGFYLGFVLSLGPKFMEKRKPYDLTRVMIGYNLFQVTFCSLMVIWGVSIKGSFSYMFENYCHPLEGDQNPLTKHVRSAAWCYFFLKVVDLLDTVFFVLRKKASQISFLHMYHHTVLVIGSWCFLKYFKGEQVIFIGYVNCFVHVVMYGYYCLSALGPQYRQYLWWKKYLTTLQMVQFMFVLAFLGALLKGNCEIPKAFAVFMTINAGLFLALFYNFYMNAYSTPQSNTEQQNSSGKKNHPNHNSSISSNPIPSPN